MVELATATLSPAGTDAVHFAGSTSADDSREAGGAKRHLETVESSARVPFTCRAKPSCDDTPTHHLSLESGKRSQRSAFV